MLLRLFSLQYADRLNAGGMRKHIDRLNIGHAIAGARQLNEVALERFYLTGNVHNAVRRYCGNGADEQYTGRMVIDQATLDRFAIIEFGYSRRVEMSISKNHMIN